MARKLTANFSNRVAIGRHSFNHPSQHSMMLRRGWLYPGFRIM